MRILLVVLAVLLLAPPAALRAAEARPNVLFLFADDQRADTIAALGNPVIKTPALDRIAKAGVAFERAYMQGGLQGATCVPSRAMLLSGQGLFRADEKLLRDETWPAAFGRAGYATFMSGKWHNGEMTVRDEQLLPWPRPPDRVRAFLAEYYRYISHLDAQIGRILDALEASPHAKSTIVVFAADSGVARGSHGLSGKQSCYEHSMRVPLVIAGPGIPAGRQAAAMCYLFDVLPTLGARCGVPAPKASEGIDLGAVLADPARPGRPHILLAYRNVQRAIRDDRWKLIRYPQVDRTQLFDLQADPHETASLADRPEHAAKVAELTAVLQQQQQHFGDTAPLKVADPKPAEWTPPAKGAKPGGKNRAAEEQ